MKLSLGFSPCPNDTFIFYALVRQKIPSKFTFDLVIEDVEKLNQRAYDSALDFTKISFNAFLDLTNQYILLSSGAALGRNCGPLLISHRPVDLVDLTNATIAIPGEKTTANFLLDCYLPFPVTKKIVPFDQIEDLLGSRQVDAGVIIHENRFTYREKGLVLIKDLGVYWEESTANPIPLGGIIGRRELPAAILTQVDELIRQSVQYAWSHKEEVLPFVRQYAQEMEESVMMNHINLYVNEFSRDLGVLGRSAIDKLFDKALQQERIESLPLEDYIL